MNISIDIKRREPIHLQIAACLRKRIISGEIKPKDRFPTTQELVQQWGVSLMVIHRAMRVLADEGLIVRKPGGGTFVKSENDRMTIGILASMSLTDEAAYFQRSLLKAFNEVVLNLQEKRWVLQTYDGLSKMQEDADNGNRQAYQSTIKDIQNHSLRGLISILGGSRFNIDKLKLNIPCVSLGSSGMQCDVLMDFYDFGIESVNYLVQKGVQEIAYIRTIRTSAPDDDLAGINDAIRLAGIMKPEIVQFSKDWMSGGELEEMAYDETIKLIGKYRKKGRMPQAILVSDDIATRGVCLALIKNGIEVPDKMMIASMANEQIFHHYGLPIIRYEFSPEKIVRAIIDRLGCLISNRAKHFEPVKVSGKIA